MFVTSNTDYNRRLFYVAMLLMPVQIKPNQNRLNRIVFSLPKVDASHAWALGDDELMLGARMMMMS